jgi:septal ring factor EnvC (AmiA/AmiB activator)
MCVAAILLGVAPVTRAGDEVTELYRVVKELTAQLEAARAVVADLEEQIAVQRAVVAKLEAFVRSTGVSKGFPVLVHEREILAKLEAQYEQAVAEVDFIQSEIDDILAEIQRLGG